MKLTVNHASMDVYPMDGCRLKKVLSARAKMHYYPLPFAAHAAYRPPLQPKFPKQGL